MKKLIIAVVIAILGLIWMLYMSATLSIKTQHTSATDYYNNGVSEQISAEWQRQASLEYGDIPRDPTAEELQYMQQFTSLKQAEINIKLQTNR